MSDLDGSGSLNDPEEFTQLCLNLMFKFRVKMRQAEFEQAVNEAAEGLVDGNEMTLEEFKEWWQANVEQAR